MSLVWSPLGPMRPLHAQETPAVQETVVVEVLVTGVAGNSLYVDQGYAAGLAVGDELRLWPVGGSPLAARVESVSRNQARLSLVGGGSVLGIPVGSRGEVRLPRARVEEARAEDEGQAASEETEAADQSTPPTEPPPSKPRPGERPTGLPWTADPVEWEEDLPLLAAAQAVEPEERPVDWSGRFFVDGFLTDDAQADQRFTFGRSGLDLFARNPFGRGGEFQLSGEGAFQTSEFADEPGEDDSQARLERFSYHWGGNRGDTFGFGVGRFLQRSFPEFGLLDGGEMRWRLSEHHALSASVGFLPEPTDDLETGDDFQVAVGYEWLSDESARDSVRLGFQKTWHMGEEDRDLAVLAVRFQPTSRLSFNGSAWVDLYGPEDDLKDSSSELTFASANLDQRLGESSNLGLFYFQNRLPQTLRNELGNLPADVVEETRITRFGLRGSTPLTDDLRLNARLDTWSDEEDSGTGGELGFDWRNAFWDNGFFSAGLFDNQGATSAGSGVRLRATKPFGPNAVSLSWIVTSFDQEDFSGTQSTLLQHLVRLHWDFSLSTHWSGSVFGEARLGDEQDATTFGLYLQRRF